jgi:hypothetical protein
MSFIILLIIRKSIYGSNYYNYIKSLVFGIFSVNSGGAHGVMTTTIGLLSFAYVISPSKTFKAFLNVVLHRKLSYSKCLNSLL